MFIFFPQWEFEKTPLSELFKKYYPAMSLNGAMNNSEDFNLSSILETNVKRTFSGTPRKCNICM